MANETVTYDLASELKEVKGDIKQIRETQNTMVVTQTKLEGKIDALQSEINIIKEDIKGIKSTLTTQTWTLVIAVATVIFRMFFMTPNV